MIKALFQGEKLDGTQILNLREAGAPGDSFELSAQKRVNFTVANAYEERQTPPAVSRDVKAPQTIA